MLWVPMMAVKGRAAGRGPMMMVRSRMRLPIMLSKTGMEGAKSEEERTVVWSMSKEVRKGTREMMAEAPRRKSTV